jgi:hypothetical protein
MPSSNETPDPRPLRRFTWTDAWLLFAPLTLWIGYMLIRARVPNYFAVLSWLQTFLVNFFR